MARKNLAIVTGEIISEPRFNDETNPTRGSCRIRIGRNEYPGADEPIVEFESEDAIAFLKTCKMNDAIHVEGTIRTAKVTRNLTCEVCHNEYTDNVILTTLVADRKLSKCANPSFSENHVILIGVSVRDPLRYEGKNLRAKYQLAINRRDQDGGTDYPFVSSFKSLAEEDLAKIRKGSQVFVDGVIEATKHTRRAKCPHCPASYSYKVTTAQVIAKSTAYLNNYNPPEELARRNLAIYTGVIMDDIHFDDVDSPTRGWCRIGIGRDEYPGYDEPMIEFSSEDGIAFLKTCQSGDSIHVEGALHTIRVKQTIECQSCGGKYEDGPILTTLTAHKKFFRSEEPLFAENHVILIGVLTGDPVTDEEQGVRTKYQVAIERAGEDGLVDYPFISSHRLLAEQDSFRLREGSQVFVDGVIQTVRRDEYKARCPHCSAAVIHPVTKTGIIAKSSEYLNNCNFPENDDPNHWAMQNIERLISR